MISAIIIAKNEEDNLEKCIKSVKWCDEIIVIDDNSTDKTSDIAKKYNATVFLRPLNNNFSNQRNFAISKAKNDWILFVDADEVVSDALAYEISNAIQLRDQNLKFFNGFYIKRTDHIWGKQLKYGEVGNISLLRLAKKGSGAWKGAAHEKWEITGSIGKLINPLQHFPHKTLIEFLGEINFYTDIKVQELMSKRTRIFFWDILLFPLGKFLISFFFKKGFMDGVHGLIFATIMSSHSFLVRSKLWLMIKK